MKKQLLLTLLLAMIANASFAGSFFVGNWRWKNNDGNETAATWRAPQNAAIEVTSQSEVLRLRIELATYKTSSQS